MKALRIAQLALVLAIPFAATTANATIPTFDAPGIGAPSHPYFLDTNGSVSVKRNSVKIDGEKVYYWQITGTGSSTSFFGPDSSYTLKNDKFKYVANFDANGKLITSIGNKDLDNYLEIRGKLSAGQIGNTSWGNMPNKLLLRADLLDSNSANGTPDLVGIDGNAIGFKTVFTGGWAANQPGLTGGSLSENLWLFSSGQDSDDFRDLVRALDGISGNGTLASLIDKSKKIERVSAVASVPVPGAVWLFGSGLVGLLASRRKTTAA